MDKFNPSRTMLDDGNELIISQKLDENGTPFFDASIYDPRAQTVVYNAVNSVLSNLLNTTTLGSALKEHGMTDGAVTSMLRQALHFDFSIPINDDVSFDIGGDAATGEISVGVTIKF
jgi:hypothetical protein